MPESALMPTDQTAAGALAAYVDSTGWSQLPPEVQREAVRCQLNWLAVALGGARNPATVRSLRALQAMGASGPALLVGHTDTVDPLSAAYINCLASAAQAFDDTHLPTITHPGGPVVSVAWAVAGDMARLGRPVTATALLTAMALGVEVQCRLSNAIIAGGRGAHLGWYMTGISGGVGAAVTAGKLMQMTPSQLSTAIGFAAAQAGGVRSTHGSMACAMVPAFAARNGMTSAYLAKAGVTCTDHVLDGKNGLFEVLSPHCDPALLTVGLGRRHEMLANAYKPYPCGIVIHAAIDACLQVAQAKPIDFADIRSLELEVHPSTLILCGRRLPQTELEAQVSLYHWAACALLRPGQWLYAASEASTRDESCKTLQSRIEASATPTLGRAQARARLTMANGEVREAMIDQATGSTDKPMTDAQLDEKFLMLAATVQPPARARELLDRCRALGTAEADPQALLALAR